ncbi:MAG: Fe-S protein assembly chaperone HscA [Planctomycetes bacterium]|nr:Fe-S protein assembly chaperone HscA [Planctomycetota bacterium]
MSPSDKPNLPPGVDPIIGIDLGTTNSLVAWCDERGPRIIPDEQGRNLLPSVVRFDAKTGQATAVGHAARDHAVEYPRETVFSVKRLMGRGLEDVRGELAYLPYEVVAGEHNTARVRIGGESGRVYSPQEISAIILRELKARAEAWFGRPVRRAVVTVPAYFDDAQRQATRDAGRIAGLDVVRIVNEPTAAALAYNLGQKHGDSTVAVFDLGGGTFDVSILRMQHTDGGGAGGDSSGGDANQVLATSGDTHLGGDDVDRMIVELIQGEIRQEFGESLSFPPATRQAFRTFAEAAKIRLSQERSAPIEVELGQGRVYRRTLTREELEAMAGPWAARALACCASVMRSSKLKTEDIERVVMVGGSTRMPIVRERVSEFFGAELYTALNPDEVVALGAAVQASILAGINRGMLLLDVIPLSLGIETMGGAVAKLITANTTIPARATEKFSTYADGQTNVKIHVLQGERELVKDCRSLGQFELRGIPPMPAGLPKIEVTFLVDANGVLNVSAVERRSEKTAKIQIVPNHGLTQEEVRRMEADSLAYAQEDMTEHRLIDLRNQARLDLRAIERQLAKVGGAMDGAYRQEIEQKMEAVRGYLSQPQPDAEAFAAALTTMDHATVRLAEIAIAKTLRETM